MFNWDSYLKLAKDFVSSAPSSPDAEAYYRCAVSRAYYSAFHKSKEYIISQGVSLNRQNKSDSHQEVVDELAKINSWASNHLSNLKKNRHDSDYKKEKVINDRKAKASIHFADNVIGQL